LGAAGLICGTVAAFVNKDGVATAALLAAGFALLFLGYLGPYITKIKFRDFEAELARVRKAAAQTLATLQEVARSYEEVRARMKPGGERDREMEFVLSEAEKAARAGLMSASEIGKAFQTNDAGKRIWVLGAMRGDPALRDFEIVLQAIEHPDARGFDQDRFLVLAADMLPGLNAQERQRLREAIERQRGEGGKIKQDMVRWATSERLLRLMDRYER
jgi:hypothetical protein